MARSQHLHDTVPEEFRHSVRSDQIRSAVKPFPMDFLFSTHSDVHGRNSLFKCPSEMTDLTMTVCFFSPKLWLPRDMSWITHMERTNKHQTEELKWHPNQHSHPSLRFSSLQLACFSFPSSRPSNFRVKLTLHRLLLEQRRHNSLQYRPNNNKNNTIKQTLLSDFLLLLCGLIKWHKPSYFLVLSLVGGTNRLSEASDWYVLMSCFWIDQSQSFLS